MRRVSLLLIAITLSGFVLLPASGYDGVPTAMVTKFSVNPPVLSPEGLGTITVVLEQVGEISIKEQMNLSAGHTINWQWTETVDIDQVSLEGNGLVVLNPLFDHIGEIGPGKSLPLTFTIRAPSKSGIYYPEVRISTSGRSVRYPIPVNVNTAIHIQKKAAIVMENTLPEHVNPGDEIPVMITLRNDGGTLAERTILKIGNVSTIVAPKTGNIYSFGTIHPGEQRVLKIVLLSDKDADLGLVHVPVTLEYTLIDGTVQNDSAAIDLLVRGEADLGLVSVDTSPRRVTANQPFDLIIRIENTGTGKAQQVSAIIELPLSGVKKSYIGKIDPGNDAPAVFLMDGGRPGSYAFNVSMTYTDESGTHTEVRQIILRVNGDDSALLALAVLLILMVCGVILYRYWYIPMKNREGVPPWVRKS